jgi:murein L,D-transpeptidase YafK
MAAGLLKAMRGVNGTGSRVPGMIAIQLISRRSLLSLSSGTLLAMFIGSPAVGNLSDGRTEKAEAGSGSLTLPLDNPRIVVTKSKRRLRLYSGDTVVKTYRVGLGLSPVDDKIKAGDRRTPEGDFYICMKNPRSQFYLSLELSYPNQKHADRGLRDGLITRAQYNQITNALNRKGVPPQNTRLGGELFIHGRGSQSDWTWGCVALDDKDIRELFDAVPIGTPVTVEH